VPDRTDADLVAAVRGGDRAAFGEMYERYADRVYGLCLTVLRRPEEAADATHDTFVRVAERLEQLRNPERLRSWMFSIARNEALQRIRRSSRLDPLEDDDDEVVPPGVVDESAEAEAVHAVAQQELSDLVWDASEGLEDRDRAVLDLYVRQGLEGEELGEAMGVSAEYAYQLTRRVRTRIDRALGALLIARLGQDDCDDLRTVLAGWDGTYDPAVRRRVVRHVDNCEVCQANRSALVSPVALFAAVPLAPVPFALKAQVLGSVEAAGLLGGTGGGAAAAGGPAGEGSQPSSGGGGGGVPPWMIGLAAVVVAAVVGLAGWLIWNASRDDDAVVEASPTSVPASDPSPPGTSVSPPPSSAPPATTPPDDSTPSVPTPTTTPTPTTSPAVTGAPTTAEAPTTAPPAPSPTPTTAPSPPPTSAAPLPAPTTTIAVTTTEPPPPVRVDVRPGIIDFGASATTATLTITNRGTTPATFSVASGAPAVAVAPASGSIAAGQAVQIDLTIDRTALSGPLAAELQLSVGGLSVPVVVVASV
jgi:RNA polymerase sigma factor (sigma-70 family)